MPDPRTLTAYSIDRVKPAKPGKRDHHWDKQVPGLALRVTDTGHLSWVVQKRLHGRMRRWTLGAYVPGKADDDTLAGSIAWARREGRDMVSDIARGVDPDIQREKEKREAARQVAGTVETVVDDFMTRYVKKQNRRWQESERIFNNYVLPRWRNRSIFDISRLDVAELLDRIEAGDGDKFKGGAVMADRALAAVRKLFNWYAARDDKFLSPVVRGMGRTRPKERARERTLSDDELRAFWSSLDATPPQFSAVVRLLLLTAQRREEVAGMVRDEISRDGAAWTIPAKRYKTKRDHVVPLTAQAREIIEAQPVLKIPGEHGRLVESPYVISTFGKSPFSGFSKSKSALDAAMLKELRKHARPGVKVTLPPWTLHDLRRSAKTLMTRSGVPHFNADRVLGHVIPGVGATYDRHDYLPEKRAALEKLAAALARILAGRSGDNVLTFKAVD